MIDVFATILFFLIACSDVLFWVYLWQLKEYRLDRLYVHMRDTQQGRSAIFSFRTVLLIIGLGAVIGGIFSDGISQYLSAFICLLLGIGVVEIFFNIFNKKVKRPVFTGKANGVIALSLFVVILLLLFPLTDVTFWLLIILLFIPFMVAFGVFLFAFPTEIYTDWYLQKAKEKRKKLKHMQVIAVSGSYGKSSTKEIIAHILSEKYRVVKTAFSNNTPFIIAKTILKDIHDDTDFFIVELGAYKRGEIKQLAEVVGPTISVTTAVSDQHLALYGSMEDVIASELELIHELPKESLVLLNGNSNGVKKMSEKIKSMHSVWYTTAQKSGDKKNTAFALHIQPKQKHISWNYSDNKRSIDFLSPLLGTHTVENILPAVFLGFYFGLTDMQIQHAVHTLKPLPKTMESKISIPGVTVIDDSFNASPESVLSANQYLRLAKNRKFFVLSPLIELGSMSKTRHEEIGEELAHLDFLFVTNKNFLNDIQKGIAKKKGKTKIITGSYRYLAKQLKAMLKKGDTVVFEGKEAGIVLKLL